MIYTVLAQMYFVRVLYYGIYRPNKHSYTHPTTHNKVETRYNAYLLKRQASQRASEQTNN